MTVFVPARGRGFLNRVLACAVCCVCLVTVGCRDENSHSKVEHKTAEWSTETRSGTEPIQVICTTGMVADIVTVIGGDQVSVEALMGVGIDPHMYPASPKDQQRLSRAEMVFYNGLHLEAQLIRVFESLAGRGRPVYAVTQKLEADHDKRLIEIDAGTHDPHIWNDPEVWAACCETVRDGLCRFDKANKDAYTSNCKKYQDEILALVSYGDKNFGTIPAERRVLVTAHDAFGYLAARYHFEVLPIQGVSTEAAAGVEKINSLVKTIVDRKVKAVFAETSVNQQYLKALVEGCAAQDHELKIGGVLYSDAMGEPDSGADTYLKMFKFNIDTITSALK